VKKGKTLHKGERLSARIGVQGERARQQVNALTLGHGKVPEGLEWAATALIGVLLLGGAGGSGKPGVMSRVVAKGRLEAKKRLRHFGGGLHYVLRGATGEEKKVV